MYKIMIIDDNHISVDGICHNIDWSDLNAEVACKAYDGQQALDYLQNNMVDLIISDIEMPQLDGLSLAQNALKINSSIKIILISAFDKFEYAKQAIRLGAFDYEEKPDGCVKKYFKNLAVCAIIAKAICAKLGGVKMKHIKTLNTQTLNNTVKKGGCGECQTSCQSACKTSCTVGNQTCENAK